MAEVSDIPLIRRLYCITNPDDCFDPDHPKRFRITLTTLLLILNHGKAPKYYKADSTFKMLGGGHPASGSMSEDCQKRGLLGTFQIHSGDTDWAFTGQMTDVASEVCLSQFFKQFCLPVFLSAWFVLFATTKPAILLPRRLYSEPASSCLTI
jgi:hypothetical protein